MMKSIFRILTIFALNFSTAQIQNSGFENTSGNLPDNWNIKKLDSYEWKLDSIQKHQGKNSLKLTGLSADSKTFQQFSQVVPIPGNGLRKIELSAYIKSENTKGKIGLWTQIWNADKQKIGFESFDSQKKKIPVNNDWTKYSLEFVIDDNAKYLLIGGLLSENGTVWFDDFDVKDIGFPNKEASKEASDYIENFKNIVKNNSVFSDKINWDLTEKDLGQLSKGAETIADTELAIRYIMKTLKNVGDNHSFIQSKENAEAKKKGNPAGMEPESKLIENKIGYIMVPAFSSANGQIGNDFAQKISDMIKKLDSENEIRGWIVDLSTNTGGNMYPMILGLGSLTGEGILGYFVTKDKKTPWKNENGKMGKHQIQQPYLLKNPDSKIAVLIGKKTASAGEATAISFIGKNNVKFFGQPTGGYTSANKTFFLSDGRGLALASSFEMDRTGKEYRGKINPDVFVESSSDKDLELETAKSWILK